MVYQLNLPCGHLRQPYQRQCAAVVQPRGHPLLPSRPEYHCQYQDLLQDLFPKSPVVPATAEWAWQQPQESTLLHKASKMPNLMGKKVSSAGLSFCIASYGVLLPKYNFYTYTRLAEFKDKPLQTINLSSSP